MGTRITRKAQIKRTQMGIRDAACKILAGEISLRQASADLGVDRQTFARRVAVGVARGEIPEGVFAITSFTSAAKRGLSKTDAASLEARLEKSLDQWMDIARGFENENRLRQTRLGKTTFDGKKVTVTVVSEKEDRRSERPAAFAAARKTLETAGYNMNPEPLTPEMVWEEQTVHFERKVATISANSNRAPIRNPNGRGAFVVAHFTDQHLDDDGCALKILSQDIKASRDMGAIICHGGDALNNWPLAGRLAKQWSEQGATLPKSLMLLEHMIKIMQPDVWVDGNHEEFNPYLESIIKKALPSHTLRDYWTAHFVVETEGGRDLRAAVSHKFQKGSSWFHKMHGHLREMLEGMDLDLYMDGHLHSSGFMSHPLPERGHEALLVASSGYKMVDYYAARISRGGKDPKLSGRAHWIACNPQAEPHEDFLTAFKSPRSAEAYMNGLQNLRAA